MMRFSHHLKKKSNFRIDRIWHRFSLKTLTLYSHFKEIPLRLNMFSRARQKSLCAIGNIIMSPVY